MPEEISPDIGTVGVKSKVNADRHRTPREGIYDNQWLKNTFIIGGDEKNAYNKWLMANRFFSTADLKSTETMPGLNIAINPQPQFTRFADIIRPGAIRQRDLHDIRKTGLPNYGVITTPGPLGFGMGRCYSESIDDNQQRVFIRFGEPQYTTIFFWLASTFDIHKAVLFKRGFISRTLITVVHAAATFFAVAAAPMLFLGKIVLSMIIQPGKFISLRDNMYTYWTVVETILNKIYVKRTNAPFFMQDFVRGQDSTIDRPMAISASYVNSLNKLVPGIIDESTGRISVHAIALRGQMAFNRMMRDQMDDNGEPFDLTEDVSNYRITEDGKHDTHFASINNRSSTFTKWFLEFAYENVGNDYEKALSSRTWVDDIEDYARRLGGAADNITLDEEDEIMFRSAHNEASTTTDGDPLPVDLGNREISQSWEAIDRANRYDKLTNGTYDKYGDYLASALSEGAAFLVLNVEPTGSVGESFSNSADSNPIESAFNAMSSKVRTLFNTAAGVTEIPLLGDAIKLGAEAVGTFLSGATMGLANPLLALAYGTTLSLPKSWNSSTAALPSASYKIRLTSPYNNAYSQLFNMYLPLAAIMAGSLPRATGRDTHTAPFMLQLFDRGRVNIPYGMVESLNITRGVSNLAFNRTGQPNAIDVDLSIIDLQNVVSLDIDGSGIFTRAMAQLSPDFTDTNLDNYVSTLTGVDVYTMYYTVPRTRLKLAERQMTLKALFTDKAAHSNWLVGSIPGLSTFQRVIGNSWQTEAQKNR